MRKDLFINLVGIAGGQLIVLIVTPFLARIYSPEQFGVYAAVMTAAGVMATVASLRFDIAIPAVPDEDLRPLFQLSLMLPVFISSLTTMFLAGVSVISSSISRMIEAPLVVVGLIAALQGSVAVCQAFFTRRGAFTNSAMIKIVQPVVFALVAFFGILGLNGALVTGWLVAFTVGLLRCRTALSSFSIRQSLAAARRAWKYPLLSSPLAILDTLSLALPLFFIVSAFGSESAGNYSQVQRLMAAPLILLGMATNQVFYKHAGDLYRKGLPVEGLLWKVFGGLFFFSMILAFFSWLFGEPLMQFLLGDGWRTDTNYILLAIAPVLFRMVASPVSSAFLFTNRVGLSGVWQVIHFLSISGLLFLAKGRVDQLGFLFMLAVCELFSYTVYFAMAVSVVRTTKYSPSIMLE